MGEQAGDPVQPERTNLAVRRPFERHIELGQGQASLIQHLAALGLEYLRVDYHHELFRFGAHGEIDYRQLQRFAHLGRSQANGTVSIVQGIVHPVNQLGNFAI